MQPLQWTFASCSQNSQHFMIKILPLFNSEENLVKALQRAEPKAQRQLYEKYAARMLAVCRRYLSDDMEAEDVMIEGFMKVFEKVEQFKNQGSFEGWIRRLMVNEALMALRKNKGKETDYDTAEMEQMPDCTWADQHLEASDLMKIIETLPAGYRTIFNLYAIEGYSHAEIAQTLGISESTSKSQLHRARGWLQEKITLIENNTHRRFGSDTNINFAIS